MTQPTPGGNVNAANLNLAGLNPRAILLPTDLLMVQRPGFANIKAAISQVNGIGGGVNIADLVGGADLDMLFKTGGIWTATGGLLTWNGSEMVVTGSIRAANATGPIILNEAATLTNPTLIPDRTQLGTGVCGRGAGFNDIGFAFNNITAVFYEGFQTGILQHNFETTGIVASVTQTLPGATQLVSSYGEVATVANVGDAIKAMGAFKGRRLTVINNGANQLQLFPGGGDNIGAGVNVSINIDAGHVAIFIGRDNINWDTLFNGDPNVSGVSFPEFQFFASDFQNPNNADWVVNALAPASADSTNAGLTVRLFDDTVEEGIGFSIEVPATATNIIFDFLARAETAPGIANTVGLNIYNRGIPNNAAVQAWSAATQLTDIDIPTNEFFQKDTQSVTLATLGITAGETTQFELTRDAPTGGTDLTGDWDLQQLGVRFS